MPPLVVTSATPLVSLLSVPPCSSPPSISNVLPAVMSVVLVLPVTAPCTITVPPLAACTRPLLLTVPSITTMPSLAPVMTVPVLVSALASCSVPEIASQRPGIAGAALGGVEHQQAAGGIDDAQGLVDECHRARAEFAVAADGVVEIVQRVGGGDAGEDLAARRIDARYIGQRDSAFAGQDRSAGNLQRRRIVGVAAPLHVQRGLVADIASQRQRVPRRRPLPVRRNPGSRGSSCHPGLPRCLSRRRRHSRLRDGRRAR